MDQTMFHWVSDLAQLMRCIMQFQNLFFSSKGHTFNFTPPPPGQLALSPDLLETIRCQLQLVHTSVAKLMAMFSGSWQRGGLFKGVLFTQERSVTMQYGCLVTIYMSVYWGVSDHPKACTKAIYFWKHQFALIMYTLWNKLDQSFDY